MLEIGPGLGVLTGVLADRVRSRPRRRARRTLEPHLRRSLDERQRLAPLGRRACGSISRHSQPPPTKLVANLPYNIATPIVAESLDGLPTIELWCVMVQREVADRFFAVPSTKAYGAVSVLVQLADAADRVPPGLAHRLPAAAERRLRSRRVPPRSRFPRASPTSGGSSRERSPTVARRSRTRSSSPASRPREAAVAASPSSGSIRPCAPRRCEPPAFVELDAAARMSGADAPAKINLALVVGPLRDDGKHEVVDRPAARSSSRDRVRVVSRPGPDGDRIRGRHDRPAALKALAAARRDRAGLERRDRRRRSRSPPVSAAAAPTRPPRCVSRTSCFRSRSRPPSLAALAATIGADVPFFLASGAQLGTRRRLRPRRRSTCPQDYSVVLVLPCDAVKTSTARRLPRLRRRGRRRRLRRAPRGASSRRSPPSAVPETSRCCRRTTSRAHRSRSGSASSVRSAPTSAAPALRLRALRRRAAADAAARALRVGSGAHG